MRHILLVKHVWTIQFHCWIQQIQQMEWPVWSDSWFQCLILVWSLWPIHDVLWISVLTCLLSLWQVLRVSHVWSYCQLQRFLRFWSLRPIQLL